MKKALTICLCAIIALISLTACGQDQQQQPETSPPPEASPPPITTPSPDPSPGNNSDNEDDMMGDDHHGSGDEDDVPEFSDTRDEAIVAALTPEGAYVHSDIEGMLVLESEKSMEELIAFVLAAADSLGATKREIDESQPDTWVYDGSLGEGQPLYVELWDDGGSVTILVLY